MKVNRKFIYIFVGLTMCVGFVIIAKFGRQYFWRKTGDLAVGRTRMNMQKLIMDLKIAQANKPEEFLRLFASNSGISEIDPRKLRDFLYVSDQNGTSSQALQEEGKNLIDRWGEPFCIKANNTMHGSILITIMSLGPNRKNESGLNDDISVSDEF